MHNQEYEVCRGRRGAQGIGKRNLDSPLPHKQEREPIWYRSKRRTFALPPEPEFERLDGEL